MVLRSFFAGCWRIFDCTGHIDLYFPLQGHTSYSVIVEFFYKYFMINYIKDLEEVQEYPNGTFTLVKGP